MRVEQERKCIRTGIWSQHTFTLAAGTAGAEEKAMEKRLLSAERITLPDSITKDYICPHTQIVMYEPVTIEETG